MMNWKKSLARTMSGWLAAGLLFTAGPLSLQSVPAYAASEVRTVSNTGYDLIHEQSFMLAPGVRHTSRTMELGGKRQSLQMMEIDTTDPFTELKAVSSRGEVSNQETVGYMIQEQEALGQRVVAGVNGDFFSSVGVPSGLQITDGEIITSPSTIKTLLLVLPSGRVKLEDSVTMTATLTAPDGEVLALNMINRTRIPSHDNHAFLFSPRFGSSTRTPEGGVEVVLAAASPNDRLQAGQRQPATVESVRETNDTPISEGQFVLSASGPKADWVREHLTAGDKVHIDVSFDKGVNQARQVLSGNSTLGKVLLKDGEIPADILDETDKNNTDIHPRTMLGTKQDKLFVVVVDGRMPGHSDGITLAEGAQYLKSLGADQAINIDGGGSSTYYARLPGDSHPSLLNRTSDGPERTVGNSLMLFTKAPVSKLASLVLESELTGPWQDASWPDAPIAVAPGSEVQLIAKGLDRHYNPVALQPEELSWTVEGGIGTIEADGRFRAGLDEGSGRVTVQSKKVTASMEVTVTDRLSRLELSPVDFVIESGAVMPMKVKAYGEDGRRVALSPDRVVWSSEGGIGSIGEDGVLTATSGEAVGTISAQYGSLTAEARVQVGPSPIIEDFESGEWIRGSEVRTVPGSVQLSLVEEPEPVRFGRYAGKLTYDFTGTEGTSGAYVQFLDEQGAAGRIIYGRPQRLGVWVYGDAMKHHLRIGITDGTGSNKIWNLTSAGGINWLGWRYVSLQVPEETVFPIKVRNIVIEEKNVNNKTPGVLYFDQFTAEYAD
ncbi:phosphodiester glycosidase family protein [Paenibacillus sp. J2TS4]|uniref:phosphodiester glycosidase family protein n=1 Tax=Paenibacillus sp. J2TS4 TaxID=2807194 RepID=UPI001B0C0B30|nr:phosphodiester glycosidase family protein [Paenibacillus sp. J2TS4]GIP35399.1 hypothetical protein J2TS4_46090 [Paenibacillus sp. J2TS4]